MKTKPYICISPDFDVLYIDAEGCCNYAYGDMVSNYSPELGPCFCFVVPGVEEWVRRYEMATDFAETTTAPSFDWSTWHYEGLCFAREIWEKLPRCYTLYYEPPYEDKSGVIGKMAIDDHITEIIDKYRGSASIDAIPLSIKDIIGYGVEREKDNLNVIFRVNKLEMKVVIPLVMLTAIRHWLLKIIDGDNEICTVHLPGFDCHFAHQTVGAHTEMGRFWISKSNTYDVDFCAYVEAEEFVRSLYLTLMTELGFGLYNDIDSYPSAGEKRTAWKPYNDLKSRKIEAFILGQTFLSEESKALVTETFVMFPDWGGCIFWDTMGVGSGGHDELYSDCGDFKINVPGLRKWAGYFDNHDDSQTYEEWWLEGWTLAKEIRKQLPEDIDLYYMCFDPQQPGKLVDYNSALPRVVVPYLS